ncbi:MAG: SRPBCC family protein [Acidobacteriota bacterium]
MTVYAGLAGIVLGMLATAADAEPVPLVEKPGHITEGVVTVDAPPAEVYALVTDYARWPAILSDVSSVKVERGGPRDARVAFHSRAIGSDVTVVFDNVPDREIRFTGVEGPPGGRAHGDYRLEPIDGGRHTRVTADLYLDVVGVPGWFVSDSYIRNKRRSKLAHDLADVANHFARRAAS